MNPAIFAVVEDLLPSYGIHHLRYSREPFPGYVFRTDLSAVLKRNNFAKWALLRWCSAQFRPTLGSNDDFFGVVYSGTVTRRALMAAVNGLAAERLTEICIHPGFPASEDESPYRQPGYSQFTSSPARQMEHDALVSEEIADLLRQRGVILRGYDGREKRL